MKENKWRGEARISTSFHAIFDGCEQTFLNHRFSIDSWAESANFPGAALKAFHVIGRFIKFVDRNNIFCPVHLLFVDVGTSAHVD